MEPSSKYAHLLVNVLGVYEENPFVTGSFDPANKKTEILDYTSKQWNVVKDYPFFFHERLPNLSNIKNKSFFHRKIANSFYLKDFAIFH